HIYGQLGAIPEVSGADGLAYGSTLTPDAVRTAAAGLRIIHENPTADQPVAQAREILETAHRVYFLGFGFHAANLERLGVPSSCAGKRVYASAKGVSSPEWELIQRRFGINLEID